MNVEQINGLKDYFALFHFGLDKEDKLTEGWLRQLYRSAGQGDNFVFNSEIFTPEKRKELSKCDWNKKLYKEDGVGKDNHFNASAIKPKFNEFKKAVNVQP